MYFLLIEKYEGIHFQSWFNDFPIFSVILLLFLKPCWWPDHHMVDAQLQQLKSLRNVYKTMRRSTGGKWSSPHRTTSFNQGLKSQQTSFYILCGLPWITCPSVHSLLAPETRSPWLVKPVFPVGNTGILDEANLYSVGLSHDP